MIKPAHLEEVREFFHRVTEPKMDEFLHTSPLYTAVPLQLHSWQSSQLKDKYNH